MKRKILPGVLLALVIGYVCLAGQIYAFAQTSDSQPSDTAIVLGAAVWNDQPSPVFAERINHAVALYQAQVVDSIVFTGGLGDGDTMTEAEAARNYALAHGIPDNVIFVETESHITRQNLAGACHVMQEKGWETAVLVSDPLHMKRAVAIAEDLGMNVTSSPTPTSRYQSWRTKLPSLLYETWFYALHLLSQPFAFKNLCSSG